MTHSAVYLTDLTSSERLTVWAIRRLTSRSTTPCKRPATLFLPCFQQEFQTVSQAFRDALSGMTALKLPALDIRTDNILSLTTTENKLLLATEATQNEREHEARSLLRTFLPFPSVLERMMFALTTLSACLAGSGYWLSSRAVRPAPLSNKAPVAAAISQLKITSGAALSLRQRWHRPDTSPVTVNWPVTDEFHPAMASP
ncbi:hypothetical protein [Acetobacter thailandicus]|uniref:hypothetical protein n=1 Tax=Acetobacter thailandicus TaxID=1502842 RepID=UPI001BAA8F64|nr:hypothetical protein [Acetobacter thailandicus]MBS0986775.1 hypothetical protein [Acetobacter thailandicus]